MTYFNTTGETGPTLAAYTEAAKTQDAAVLALFRRHPGTFMSPSMVCGILNKLLGKNWPPTSIRRSMTTLTDDGLLEKTGTKSKGPYGRSEYRWTLSPGQ